MKLFEEFEAVRFSEENLIFITHNEYLYYIYKPERQIWQKYRNAGNDRITVKNYPDVSREELMEAMGGIFPRKETDFMRLCRPWQLCIRDMMDLFQEDYPDYISDYSIYRVVHWFLLESDICYKSYLRLRNVFDNAITLRLDHEKVVEQIKDQCFEVIGRDIFKREIRIVDGHNSSSYFWIMPVRVIDDTNTDNIDNVAEMRSIEISIEESDVYRYLTPFLFHYFDAELEANKKRMKHYWTEDDGNKCATYYEGFEWNLTHNFYTMDSVRSILKDISDTADALSEGRKTDFISKIRMESAEERELVIDFYRRFIFRMEYMLRVGEEKGYDLISFMGP